MESDLISRNSMRTSVALYMAENAYLNDTALDVLKMIDKWLLEAEAVDAVPVVRCKDCIHRHRGSRAKCTGRRPDEFCSDGERRFKDATD